MEKLTESQKTKAARLDWLQTEIAKLKVEEAALRNDLFARVFTKPKEGAGNKAELPGGYIMQATHKINRKVDQVETQKLFDGDNTKDLAAGVFKATYSLKLAAFKALSDADKLLFSEAVTEKPGMPTVVFKQPKR